MQVAKADAYTRNGHFSQALLQNDVGAISSLYRANGFSHVQVNTAVKMSVQERRICSDPCAVYGGRGAATDVWLSHTEWSGSAVMKDVKPLMNTLEGQPFSLSTVSGDSRCYAAVLPFARVRIRPGLR